jgi:hypothetical protein
VKWQTHKDRGEYICLVEKKGIWLTANRIQRVVHHSTSEIRLRATRCVRYKNRWHPLHEASEWVDFLKSKKTEGVTIILSYPITRSKKGALPFLLDWDEPGTHYEVFGY